MKLSTSILGMSALLTLLQISAFAAPTNAKKAAASAPIVYECTKCHMKYSAATAKKDHYKDAMDGGTLVPVKVAPKASPSKAVKKSATPASSAAMKSMGM